MVLLENALLYEWQNNCNFEPLGKITEHHQMMDRVLFVQPDTQIHTRRANYLHKIGIVLKFLWEKLNKKITAEMEVVTVDDIMP